MARPRRYTTAEVHPLVFEMSKAWSAKLWTSGFTTTDGEYSKLYYEHQKVWFNVYGAGLFLGIFASAASFVTIIALARASFGREVVISAAAALMMIIGAYAVYAYQRNSTQITLKEMEMLRQGLVDEVASERLRPVFDEYIRAFVELESSQSVPRDDCPELRSQLNSLLSEAVRLTDQHESLTQMLGQSNLRLTLAEEVQELSKRYESSIDEMAKETYRAARDVAQTRLDRFGAGSPILERTEAQLELIRQTLTAFRETLSRLRGTPAAAVTTEIGNLRSQVGSIQSQSQALESAYQELNTLRLTD